MRVGAARQLAKADRSAAQSCREYIYFNTQIMLLNRCYGVKLGRLPPDSMDLLHIEPYYACPARSLRSLSHSCVKTTMLRSAKH